MIRATIEEEYKPFGSGLPRSPGVHVSQIIRSLQTSLGLLRTAPGWEMGVCQDIGFLWEDALSIAYAHKRVWSGDEELDKYVVPGVCGDIFRPDEQVMDGIICSPDGFGPDPHDKEPMVNHEFKCTWRSINNVPEADFYWLHTFMSYCRALSTNVTVVHIMYLMGNWKNTGPMHIVYRLEFTQEEMDKSWEMVLRHKEEM